MNIPKILEDSAAVIGLAVMQGTAANQVKKPTALTDVCLGVLVGSQNNEAFVAADHVSVAQVGEITPVVAAVTLTSGQSVGITIGGGAVPITGITTIAAAVHQFRLGRVLENALAGDLVEAVITNDFVPVNP